MLALNAQQDDLKNVENDSFSNSSDDDNESDDTGSDVIEKPHGYKYDNLGHCTYNCLF